jgi:hypothetical protein
VATVKQAKSCLQLLSLKKIQLQLTTTLIRQWQEITVGVGPMFELEKPSTQLPRVLP